METRLVKVRDVSAHDERAWRELALRSWEPNPFLEPDFLMLCARHLPGYADTTLVVAQDGEAFRAVIPIVGFERPRVPPRKIASSRGRPTAVRLLGTPLLDAEGADAAMWAVLDALHEAARKRHWPGIVWIDKMGDDGPVAHCLRRMCRARGLPVFTKETWDRGVVHRGGRWASPLGSKRRREIERRRRTLSRDSGAEVTLVDRTLDPSVIDDFLRMEMSGWKGKEGGLAFAKDAATTAWFRQWFQCWANTGRLNVLCLQAGDVPVAIEFFVRGGDGIFCFRGAYDEAYSKYGPGAMVIADCTGYLREHTDAQWIDSAADKDNVFMSELFPERRTLSTMFIGVGGTLDRSVVSALPAMTRLVTERRRLQGRWRQDRSRASVSAHPRS